jgi:hypothetical protein
LIGFAKERRRVDRLKRCLGTFERVTSEAPAIEEEAELELAGSVALYEKRRPGLGLDFEAATQEALKRIATSP